MDIPGLLVMAGMFTCHNVGMKIFRVDLERQGIIVATVELIQWLVILILGLRCRIHFGLFSGYGCHIIPFLSVITGLRLQFIGMMRISARKNIRNFTLALPKPVNAGFIIIPRWAPTATTAKEWVFSITILSWRVWLPIGSGTFGKGNFLASLGQTVSLCLPHNMHSEKLLRTGREQAHQTRTN